MEKQLINTLINQMQNNNVFEGGGEMGELMRRTDWSKTPVGPVESWPQSLKTTVNMLLNSKFGMFLCWGPDLVQFYNDNYRESFGLEGEKHPNALGQKGKECWTEIWDIITPDIDQVMNKGIATWSENQLVPINRNGILEEVYWTYSDSPVFDEEGKVAGILVVETETTKQVIGERRTKFLRELAVSLSTRSPETSIHKLIQQNLKNDPKDIPFAMLYLPNEETNVLELTAVTGIDEKVQSQITETLNSVKQGVWPVKEVLDTSISQTVKLDSSKFGQILCQPWPEPVTQAYVMPILLRNGEKPSCVFIAGLSPRLLLNDEYKDFLHSVNEQLSAGISRVKTHEKEIVRQHELESARNEAEVARKRLYDLFMHAPAVIAVFSGPEIKFEIANPLYRQLVGVQRPLDGKPLFEAIPDIEPELREIIKKVVTKGERFVAKELPVNIDWDLDGNIYSKYLQLLYEPLFENGKPNGMMAFAFDVTEQVRAREIVEEQNSVLKMITEGKSLADALDFLVRSIERQSGSDMKASILLLDNDGKHLRHGAAPNLPQEYNDAINGVAIGPTVGSCGTAAFIKKPVIVEDISTEPLWYNFKELAAKFHLHACWSTPIFSTNKKVLGTFALYYHEPRLPSEKDRFIIDFATRTASLLIERKNSEQALLKSTAELEQQKRMYDSITGSTPDLVYVIGTDYKFVFVNEALLNMWGKTLEESIGKRFVELGYEPWHAQKHEAEVDQVIATKKPIRGEVAFPHAMLGERIYDYIFAPIFDADGEVISIAGTTRDISELKRLEKQKDEFIAIASHELKTPITSIKAYAQLLQLRFEKQSDTSSYEMMNKMDLQINKLTNLINDLLDVTKMEGGKLQFNSRHFQLNDLIKEISEEVQRTTSRHSIHLSLSGNVTVFGDSDRIGQVLINYLTNAIKYSPKANRINIRSEASEDSVTVAVEDFGLGIPENKKDKVFERFYRVDGRKQETFAGLGLGLFISKEIIARHSGRVWVESIVEKGSTFYFSLPLNNDINS